MIDYPKRRENVILRDAGDDVAVYDPSTGTLVQLNPTALAIWQACDGVTTLDEITGALVVLTGLDADALRVDVDATIEMLTERGLLERE